MRCDICEKPELCEQIEADHAKGFDAGEIAWRHHIKKARVVAHLAHGAEETAPDVEEPSPVGSMSQDPWQLSPLVTMYPKPSRARLTSLAVVPGPRAESPLDHGALVRQFRELFHQSKGDVVLRLKMLQAIRDELTAFPDLQVSEEFLDL